MELSEKVKEKYIGAEIFFPMDLERLYGIITDVDELGFTVKITNDKLFNKSSGMNMTLISPDNILFIPHTKGMIFKIIT